MGKPPCRDGSTPPLRPLPSLSSLPSLRSLPAPTHTLRQRGRRGQLLAVGANAMGLAQSVGLLLSTDRLVKGAAGSGGEGIKNLLPFLLPNCLKQPDTRRHKKKSRLADCSTKQ